jgi:cytochrome P450
MSREEITKLTSTLIIAGSETSATLLSGAIFNLLSNPTTLAKLTTEIRTLCPDPKDMTFLKLAGAPYLNACLQEALRVYPSLPALLPRKTEKGGAVINGTFIPEGVRTFFRYV